jgi:hypothetical protein
MTSDVQNARLDAALSLARNGFKIFPIEPNSKVPAIKNWQTLANDNPDLISKWWVDEFPGANIGISTEGLCVIDVDPRNGGQGSWDAIMLAEDAPDTATQQTQSGGVHHIYKLPDGLTVPNSRSKLGPGIDIKSAGGYIVAPGSEIDGRPYRWFKGFEGDKLAMAPQWLLDQARAPRQRTSASGQRVADESTEAVAMATDYLWNRAPRAEQGNRDNTAFAVAAKLFDYGLSETSAWQMLCAWNDARCEPPLEDHDVDRIIESAQKNRTRAIGAASPNAPGFEAVEIRPRSEVQNAKSAHSVTVWEHALAAADKAITHAGDPLITGVLDRGTMSVLYGESGSGKTFVALDMAAHISGGQEWNGRKARQGAVLYVAAEGGRAIYKRFAAIKKKTPELLQRLYVVRLDVDLVHDRKHVNLLVDAAKQVAAHARAPVELVVIDTLSRALAGGDENSPVDMGHLVKSLDAIRSATGSHVMVIHHSGKNAARGARGHSLLRAATDTEIEVKKKVMRATKQRDLDTDFEMAFKLIPLQIGERDGDRITSCTVEWRTVTEADDDPAPLSPELVRLKGAILAALPPGVMEFTWADLVNKLPAEFVGIGKASEAQRKAFKPWRDKLVSGGHLSEMPGKRWLVIASAASEDDEN